MILKRIAMVAVVAAVGLTGCMQTKPKTVEEYMVRCIKDVQYWDLTFKSELTQHMGTTPEKMPELFCRRLLVAVQKGRVTHKDAIEMFDKASPIWKVIKGQ